MIMSMKTEKAPNYQSDALERTHSTLWSLLFSPLESMDLENTITKKLLRWNKSATYEIHR